MCKKSSNIGFIFYSKDIKFLAITHTSLFAKCKGNRFISQLIQSWRNTFSDNSPWQYQNLLSLEKLHCETILREISSLITSIMINNWIQWPLSFDDMCIYIVNHRSSLMTSSSSRWHCYMSSSEIRSSKQRTLWGRIIILLMCMHLNQNPTFH